MPKKGDRRKKVKIEDEVRPIESELEPARTLKSELENVLKRSGYKRDRERSIISIGSIKEIYKSSGTLQPSLELDIQRWRKTCGLFPDTIGIALEKLEKPGELENYIRNDASKLYALLQLLDRSEIIIQTFLLDERVTDDMFEKNESPSDKPYCTLEWLRARPHLREVATQIFETQWLVPPILRDDTDPIFPVKMFRFPFMEEPEGLGQGQAQVFSVKIAEGHLSNRPNKGSVVAYKEVCKDGLDENFVMNEVQTIRDRKHDYIVKLFASFSAGRENPWGPDCRVECLHMLFEHTKSGNMHTWLWLEEDEYTEKERHDHIKETIQTIVEAVTCIHESRNGDIAFHHDLKPSNILRFEGPPAVWKICDFGMAKLKNVNDGSATVHRTDNHFGTYDYQPPEYFDDAKDPRHGRPFDMWSLGCIMLELLTVWKHGRKKSGIREFRRRRGENTVIESPKRWQGRDLTSSKEDYSFHNNRITIQEWMEHLRDGTAEGDDFCRLLDLVEEMLVDRYQRIFIWELHMDLFEMTYPRPTQEKLIKEYRRVVQPSGHPIDDASNHHNPLKRALKRRKTWQESILVREKWSVCKPKPSTELNVEVRGSTRFYSTLQECTLMDTYEQGTLFGRQDMDDRITGAFRVSSIVGLFGIAGIGKSHHAYHYVSRFQNPPSAEYKRHVFWLEATSCTRLEETVHQVAAQIDLPTSPPEDVPERLRGWLSTQSNGPWILVVDGLNNNAIAHHLKRLIPTNSGQILITTKDRAIIDTILHLRPHVRKENSRIHVQDLPVPDLRAVFQWCGAQKLPVSPETDELLSNFPIPGLVISLARYALKLNMAPSLLYSVTNSGRKNGVAICFPESMYQDVTRTYRMFEHLNDGTSTLTTPVDPFPSSFSPVLKLLGELSCLHRGKLYFHLIRQNYEIEDKLLEMLGMLENCSLIVKGRTHEIYSMPEFVQVLMRRWTWDNLGFTGLLKMYLNTVLMLHFQYKEETRPMVDAKKLRRSSYLTKLPLMPHFEQFLALTREHRQHGNDLGSVDADSVERMVQAVTTFAPVLVEEGRYDDAVCVLEFANSLYKGMKHRSILTRRLCEAYTRPPLANRSDEAWTKASTLLGRVIHELSQQPQRHLEQEWYCSLALSNIHSKYSRPETARKILRTLHAVTVQTGWSCSGTPYLRRKGGQVFKPAVERKLAISKCIAEGLACTAEANYRWSWQRKRRLHAALSAFEKARHAITKWFPSEDRWLADLDELTAKVLGKMGTPKTIKRAIAMYQNLYERYQKEVSAPDRPWSQTRAWALKCKIARAQIQLWPDYINPGSSEVIDTLQTALKFFEEHHHQRDGKHNDHTRACAYILHDAYATLGREEEARYITERYGLKPIHYEHFSDTVVEDGWWIEWLWGVLLIASVAYFLFCIAFPRHPRQV